MAYSKHETALLAELLADRLIEVYQSEQVPAMVDDFAQAGFTQAALRSHPDQLYLMLVTAAYDRRPFTPAAGGFEEIWGKRRGSRSIPAALDSLGLSTPGDVLSLDQTTLARRLSSEPYYGKSLATDESMVHYDRTLTDAARLVREGLHRQALEPATTDDVQTLYRGLTSVHGIGETIGSKLVKYLLREIGLGHVPPNGFPLSVVWPLADEYHLDQAVTILSGRVDRALVPLTMGLLIQRGDPFAIDALFFLHRHRIWELDGFAQEAREMMAGWATPSVERPSTTLKTSDVALAQRLMVVIREIYDGSCGITPAQIRQAGLEGIVTPQRIEESARWLLNEMGALAARGRAGEMLAFYRNCLKSEDGKLIGWALEQLGRTSMESEEERFRAIHEGRA